MSTPVGKDLAAAPVRPVTWLRALRVYQWVKNLLIFVPLLLAAPVTSLRVLPAFVAGFLVLCLFASSTYLVNDLVDLEADRAHRTKRLRPIASGAISFRAGVVASILLCALGLLPLWWLPGRFAVAALVYLATTVSYSFAIKRVALLDTLCLAFLFTLRIFVGTVLVGGPSPYWLFAFSMFFFLSLALVKRYTEIHAAIESGREYLSGRGYRAADLATVQVAGIATAMSAIVVFLIYLGDQQFNRNLFSSPHWMALTCGALAYWLLRIWLLAGRDEMHDDPILFAIRDRTSIALGVVVLISLALAW